MYYDANGNGTCDDGERCTIYNGLGWAANAGTKNPDACWSLIEWLSSEEMQTKQADLGVTLSGYVGADENYAAAFPEFDISAIMEMNDNSTLIMRPYSKYTLEWENYAATALVAPWNDPSQLHATLDDIASYMNQLLATE